MVRLCTLAALIAFSLALAGCATKPVGKPAPPPSQTPSESAASEPVSTAAIRAELSAGKYDSVVAQCSEMLDALADVDCFDSIAVNHPLDVATDPWIGTGRGINIRGYPWENPDIVSGRVPWKSELGPKVPTPEALYQLQRHDRNAVLLFYYRAKALHQLGREDEAAEDYAHAYELVRYEQYCDKTYKRLHVRREYHSIHADKYDPEQVILDCEAALKDMGRSLPGG